jgi:carboxyl-terminal processing protease
MSSPSSTSGAAHRRTTRRVLWLVPLVAGSVGAAFVTGRWYERRFAQARNEWAGVQLLSSAIDSVRANALDSLPNDELIRRAVTGMLRELQDPYAALLQSDGMQRYRGTLLGEGHGLGLTMRRHADGASIARVAVGSPAMLSGIRAGDRLLAVDGVPVEADGSWGRNSDSTKTPPDQHLVTVWRAPLGDTVRLVVRRSAWRVPAVSDAALLSDSLGYVRLASMTAHSAEEVERAVSVLVQRGARALVLDLRGNNGGLFEEGVKVASLFLSRGVVVASLAGRGGDALQPHEARHSRWPTLPLTVLVDRQTASAAEVIAAALREHNRALLVGEPTYGKGVVQRVVNLSPDIALRLTTARWLTPSGRALERNPVKGGGFTGGLLPDVVVEQPGRRDLAAVPREWTGESARRMDQLADSMAVHALRAGWATRPLAVFEARLRASLAQLTPRALSSPLLRADWVTQATRLALVRHLEIEGERETILRYALRDDAALRAGADVLLPGEDLAQVIPAPLPALLPASVTGAAYTP